MPAGRNAPADETLFSRAIVDLRRSWIMRQLAHRAAFAGMALACLGWAATAAAQTAANRGAVVQSVPPPVSQKVSPPPLHLSDAQRNQIQQALCGENTEVTFGTQTTKPTQSFNPTVVRKFQRA
jgi:hypothetical protein